MLIDSVVIKLVRAGAGVGPDYTLAIYGNGTVTYEGRDNVKVEGDIKESISDEKIMELLTEFKDSGFFSFESNYLTAGTQGKSLIIISITMPTGNGNTITKKITHYLGDENVPKELIALENKIDKIVGTERWIGKSLESGRFKSRNEKDENRKKPIEGAGKKNVIIAVFVSIILVSIVLIYFTMDFGEQDNSSNQIDIEDDYLIPEITKYTTASSVTDFKIFNPESNFEPGDTIYVYFEYINVSIDENEACDIKIDLEFSLNENIIHETSFSETEYNNYLSYAVPTEESWEIGLYDVKLTLTDQVSSKKVSSTISFVLSEKTLVITKLLSVGSQPTIGDYDPKDDFVIGETVYIYQEYEGFTVDENNDCSLYLFVRVIGNDKEVYYNTTNVTDSSFKGYAWWFTPDESWPSTQYLVISYIMDRFTSESYLEDTMFTIS